MGIVNLIVFLIIGAVIGWLAGQIVKGGGFGLVGDIIVGIIGSLLGGYLFSILGINLGGGFGQFITALIGAVILVAIIRAIRR